MNQSTISVKTKQNSANSADCQGATSAPQLSVFQTDFGWFSLWGHSQVIHGLSIGHLSSNDARNAAEQRIAHEDGATDVHESDWFPEIRSRLLRYAQGHPDSFSDCQLRLGNLSAFQERVFDETRKIHFGETLTYGELAQKAGSPRAARAVGSVMSSNRIPLIIPCHRVVASGGRLGGYSSPRGIALKEQLLAMETR